MSYWACEVLYAMIRVLYIIYGLGGETLSYKNASS